MIIKLKDNTTLITKEDMYKTLLKGLSNFDKIQHSNKLIVILDNIEKILKINKHLSIEKKQNLLLIKDQQSELLLLEQKLSITNSKSLFLFKNKDFEKLSETIKLIKENIENLENNSLEKELKINKENIIKEKEKFLPLNIEFDIELEIEYFSFYDKPITMEIFHKEQNNLKKSFAIELKKAEIIYKLYLSVIELQGIEDEFKFEFKNVNKKIELLTKDLKRTTEYKFTKKDNVFADLMEDE